MPRKRPIRFAASAVADLEGIRAWYNELELAEVGERLLREVLVAVERLAEFPESGRVVPEFGIAELREVIYPPYRIVYRLDKDRVRIVRVWRSERLMRMPQEGAIEPRDSRNRATRATRSRIPFTPSR